MKCIWEFFMANLIDIEYYEFNANLNQLLSSKNCSFRRRVGLDSKFLTSIKQFALWCIRNRKNGSFLIKNVSWKIWGTPNIFFYIQPICQVIFHSKNQIVVQNLFFWKTNFFWKNKRFQKNFSIDIFKISKAKYRSW